MSDKNVIPLATCFECIRAVVDTLHGKSDNANYLSRVLSDFRCDLHAELNKIASNQSVEVVFGLHEYDDKEVGASE